MATITPFFGGLPRLPMPVAIILLASFSIFTFAVYRVYIHPLAGIPGPPFQRLSGLPRILQCRRGDRYLREKEAHDQYGSVIRIAPNAICFNTVSALQTIYAKDSNVFKGDEFYGSLDGGAEGGRSIMMEADNTAHAARRRVLDKSLPSREQAFRDLNSLALAFASAAFAEDNNEPWSKAVDIARLATWFSFDVIGTVAFGDSLDMIHRDEYRWVPQCLQSASIFLYWAGYSPCLRLWQWLLGTTLPTWLRLQTAKDSQRYVDFADEMFNRRRALLDREKDTEAKRTDIFQGLISSKLYNDLEMRADSSLLIAAGSDAIRLVISATIFYWLKNPQTFEKAAEEIRSSVSSADQVSDSVLGSLRYLRASIDETMRLSPPKAGSLPREVLKGGIMVDKVYVPEGYTVGVSVYALHHNADIFPDPYSYSPERWLEQDRRLQAAFCPFLKGPRACPGKTVAYFAMELALFHLVYRYDIRAADSKVSTGGHSGLNCLGGREDEYQFKDWILGYTSGPEIELKER